MSQTSNRRSDYVPVVHLFPGMSATYRIAAEAAIATHSWLEAVHCYDQAAAHVPILDRSAARAELTALARTCRAKGG